MSNKKYQTPNKLNWCPGCGNFAIWEAFQQAADKEGWDNSNTVFTAGIGCHGHIVNFMKLNAFEGLHGRPLPLASGVKMANSDLNVFVFSGDGDCLAEGGNHFIHTARRNHDITLVLHDNAVYGLTTGQTSPRSPRGYKSKSTPSGVFEEPIHPLNLALSAGATFLARVYSGNIEETREMLIAANKHKGFAVIDVLQPCVTFNHEYSHFFFQENTYSLPDSYDPTDKEAAFMKTIEWGLKKIPTGILYKVKQPSYEQQIMQIQKKSLVKQGIVKRDISKLMAKMH